MFAYLISSSIISGSVKFFIINEKFRFLFVSAFYFSWPTRFDRFMCRFRNVSSEKSSWPRIDLMRNYRTQKMFVTLRQSEQTKSMLELKSKMKSYSLRRRVGSVSQPSWMIDLIKIENRLCSKLLQSHCSGISHGIFPPMTRALYIGNREKFSPFRI